VSTEHWYNGYTLHHSKQEQKFECPVQITVSKATSSSIKNDEFLKLNIKCPTSQKTEVPSLVKKHIVHLTTYMNVVIISHNKPSQYISHQAENLRELIIILQGVSKDITDRYS
jgi:hypothetical protein